MYIIKNALVSIKRNVGRNLLLLIIIIVLSCATVITLAIRNAANTYVTAYENKNDIEATLEVNRENVMKEMESGTDSMEDNIEKWNDISSPTVEEINNYGDSEYVKSYYYTYNIGINADDITAATDSITKTTTDKEVTTSEFVPSDRPSMPGGERGGKTTTSKTTTHSEEIKNNKASSGSFSLIGYSSYESMSDFITGNYTITDGSIDSDFTSNSCIVSEELANLNELSVGDTITLVSTENTKNTYEYTITGIYKDNSKDSNDMTKMYSNSANNIITNISSIETIISDNEDTDLTITPTFILNNKDSADSFSDEVSEKGLSDYYTVSTNVEEIENDTKTVSSISKYASTFLLITLIIGAVVLFVINMINVRERKYEIGVLRTIGMKKILVINQFVVELLVVSFFGLAIGAGIGSTCSVKVANNMLSNEIETTNSQKEEINNNFGDAPQMDLTNGVAEVNEIEDINAVVNFKVLLQLFGIGLLLTLVSSLAAMINIAKFSPLTILKERS